MVSEELRKRLITGGCLAVAFIALDILANYFDAVRLCLAILSGLAVLLCSLEVVRMLGATPKLFRLAMPAVFCLPVISVFVFFAVLGGSATVLERVSGGFSAGVAS
ncbi:MAG: hypothetical protein EBZ48_15310, partial [Proteobacteria bacterium]|nr:hypothetical protein [Pseudomonadota bacterium]